MEILVNGDYNTTTRRCNLTITVNATGQIQDTNLKLRIAVTESNIAWSAPNGGYWHHQVFRNMYPSTSGVSFNIAQGETYNYEYSFTLNSQINHNNCDIVAFVQSDNGHSILQGGKSAIRDLRPLSEFEPFSLLTPVNGAELTDCYPEFTWEEAINPGSSNEVTYTVYIDDNSNFDSPFTSPTITQTSWISEICLPYDVVQYWKVLASDGSAQDRFSEEVYSLVVLSPPPCQYIVGDYNGDSMVNVTDVVNAFSRLKAGTPEPAIECECPYGSGMFWAVAMDVNNSCTFNVSDVVDAFSKLKTGSPNLVPCASCPPN